MTLDTDRFRGALLKRKEHLEGTIAHHDIGGQTLTDATGELSDSTPAGVGLRGQVWAPRLSL